MTIFQKSEGKIKWIDLLDEAIDFVDVGRQARTAQYPKILADKSFTYSLFRSLARDFNGDMFLNIDDEENAISQKHLDLIQGLLYGNAGIQKKLFFSSYHFDIIPLDLISSIYEEFYHSGSNSVEESPSSGQAGWCILHASSSCRADFIKITHPESSGKKA